MVHSCGPQIQHYKGTVLYFAYISQTVTLLNAVIKVVRPCLLDGLG